MQHCQLWIDDQLSVSLSKHHFHRSKGNLCLVTLAASLIAQRSQAMTCLPLQPATAQLTHMRHQLTEGPAYSKFLDADLVSGSVIDSMCFK